jgi:hypothetical protein
MLPFWNSFMAQFLLLLVCHRSSYWTQTLACWWELIFWGRMPLSPLKANRSFDGICRLHHQIRRMSQERNHHEAQLATFFMVVSCSVYSSILKIEVTRSSKISVHRQRTRRHGIPEDRPLHNHRCENLKSHLVYWKLGCDSGDYEGWVTSVGRVTLCSPVEALRSWEDDNRFYMHEIVIARQCIPNPIQCVRCHTLGSLLVLGVGTR